MIESEPKFIQGVATFTGAGFASPQKLAGFGYAVPSDKRAQTIYFRAGNSCDEMVAIVLLRDGKTMRYFPIGAKSAIHVPLSVVEDLEPEQQLEFQVLAPEGATGTIVLDTGLLEI